MQKLAAAAFATLNSTKVGLSDLFGTKGAAPFWNHGNDDDDSKYDVAITQSSGQQNFVLLP